LRKLFTVKQLFIYSLSLAIVWSSCSPNNVTEDNSVKKYFDSAGVTGCFGLFNNGEGSFTVYNLARFRDSVYSPASTFKIVNSLIGLQTGRVTNEKTIFKWDTIYQSREECEKDMTMEDAFRLSCPPWYQQLAKKIGKDTMQYWLDTLGYARKYDTFKITNNLDMFWLDNTMKITADEELGLVKKLYFDQLPFQKRPQEIVRNMMKWEDNANYQLSYKTGWAVLPNSNDMGWIVGWIEENKHPYFFVLQVESSAKNADIKTIRMKILKSILKQYGFFEGKK
jgi:beta-lactamase class D